MVSIIPLLVAGVFMYLQGAKYVRQQMYNQIASISKSIISDTAVFIRERIDSVKTLTNNEALGDIILRNKRRSERVAKMSSYLSRISKLYLEFQCIVVFDKEGNVVGSSKPDNLHNDWIMSSYKEEGWYKKMFKYYQRGENSNGVYVEGATLSSFTSDYYSYNTMIASPLKNGDSLLGYVVGFVNWGYLYVIINETEIGEEKQGIDAYVNIVSKDGRVLISPEFQRRTRTKGMISIYDTGFVNYPNFSETMTPREMIYGDTVINGDSYIFSATRATTINNPGELEWTAVVAVKTRQALRPIRNMTIIISIFLVILIIMCIMVSSKLSKYISKPLLYLSSAMKDYYRAKGVSLRKAPVLNSIELKQLFESFQQMACDIERYQREDKIKTRMVSVGQVSSQIAHDMRSPLSMLKTYVNAKPEDLEDDYEEYNNAARRSVNRLLHMADDLVNYSKAQKVDRNVVALEQLIYESTSHITHDYDKKSGLRIDYLIQKTSRVFLDHYKMSRVIVNLLNNAFQAACGSIQKVDLVIESKEKSVLVLRVADNGVGINPEFIPYLFDRFFTKGKVRGTGLGLSYCKQVVEAHGGTIEVESELGKGSTFTVTIPDCIIEEVNKVQSGIRDLASGIREGDVEKLGQNVKIGKNVMLVDDDPDMIDSWKRIIDRNGGTIQYTAYSADTVINDKKFDTSDVDTAIIDYHYEGFNTTGIELIRFLRAKGIKNIHLCTAFYDNEDIQKMAEEAGADSVIPKPIDENLFSGIS